MSCFLQVGYWLQGCCLTGAWQPGAPKLRMWATKFLHWEPVWAPNIFQIYVIASISMPFT